MDGFFHEKRHSVTLTSARIVTNILVEEWKPQSVVDVGCGVGTWLRAFEEKGIEDYLGIDAAGSPARDRVIPASKYRGMDLRRAFAIPRRFDMALSLEVAEHLPETSATGFVESLSRLSDVIVFGAAIPGQGGFRHINCQWPGYWARLFSALGFVPYDTLRWKIWDAPDVLPWYAQNMILYVRREIAATRGVGSDVHPCLDGRQSPVAVVHPRLWELTLRRADVDLGQTTPSLRYLLGHLPHAVLAATKRRVPFIQRRLRPLVTTAYRA